MPKTRNISVALATHPHADILRKRTVLALLSGLVLAGLFTLIAQPARALQPDAFLVAARSAAAPMGAQNLCRTYAWACAANRNAGQVRSSELSTIKAVNRAVNRSVRDITDAAQFRVQERWSLPTHRGGDCEDFALLKKQELIRHGFPPQALLIATVLDRNRNGHAVLIVRTDRGDLVLDNLTDRIKKWSDTGYIFLRMQNPDAPSRWVSVVSASR